VNVTRYPNHLAQHGFQSSISPMSNLDVSVQRNSSHKTNKSTFAFRANCWWKIKYFNMQKTKLSTSQRCGIKCPLLCSPLLGHWVIQCHSELLQRMVWFCLIPHASKAHGHLSLGSDQERSQKPPCASGALCSRPHCSIVLESVSSLDPVTWPSHLS